MQIANSTREPGDSLQQAWEDAFSIREDLEALALRLAALMDLLHRLKVERCES